MLISIKLNLFLKTDYVTEVAKVFLPSVLKNNYFKGKVYFLAFLFISETTLQCCPFFSGSSEEIIYVYS